MLNGTKVRVIDVENHPRTLSNGAFYFTGDEGVIVQTLSATIGYFVDFNGMGNKEVVSGGVWAVAPQELEEIATH